MFRFTIIICIFLFSSSLNFNATPPQKGKKQTQKKKAGKKTTKSTIKWKSLSEGLDYAEIKAPVYSRVNDNLITALKINPKFYKFELASSSENDSVEYTVQDWCALKGLTAGINACMYKLKQDQTSMGFMKNYNHYNNPEFRHVYRAMLAFNRIDNSVPEFMIIDLDHDDWKHLAPKYNTFVQNIKMVDANGKRSSWKKKKGLRSSMVVMATDADNNVLFLFTRSPYSIDVFSSMLLSLPLDIKRAAYLEGGPESSFYVNTKDTLVEKVGSYVYPGWTTDLNKEFRKLPNIIGVKKK
ncbi:MAG: hypothetical protein A2275_16090 [Bacteroidetes bacterium RIFOXYA12_FULL_35_11]|nr:MAG: hypothetical protein A2X01_05260 [Bacteroidetes bacterium GWF2_35_48]OFY75896.1 MAG: hypothetical protein A2275_16090 [Bacteroidetes bacterium RIFOXYA12_FULL_35_11]OFY92820.1 MAG: hypothetical protein A2491_07625 [Bacteroidetes bacterium RIFOXYC12_FULL_35_7]